MKPGLIITLVLLSIASISTISVLFFNQKAKPPLQKSTTTTHIDIKWGEGSEAGTPDKAVDR